MRHTPQPIELDLEIARSIVGEQFVIIPRATLNEWWCQLLATDEVAQAWTTDRCLKVADEMRVKFDASYLGSPAPVWVIRPAGWQLVPIEPTREMVQSGARLVKNNLPFHTGTLAIYEAMLAAAPTHEEPGK